MRSISRDDLNKLTERELDSLLLFALYKMMGEVPEYSTLSELAFLLDRKTLMKFLSYFGGCTIKIPTLSELHTLTDALLLYEYVDLENIQLDKAMSLLAQDKTLLKKDQIKKTYIQLSNILSEYDLRLEDKDESDRQY